MRRAAAVTFALLFFASIAAAQSVQPRKNIPAIAKSANGAVVSIVMSDEDGKPIAQGSGFLVSKDGLIVTNYHVIAEGTSAVVKLPDGAFFVVDGVLASDKTRDVAVIKAHGENFRTLALGNSDRVQVGQEVVAIGNPLSLESTVSNGIVSGVRTDEKLGGKFLQVTTPISPGSSGGPLFNMEGQVVGITTLYLKGGENLNFAIPINDAKRLLLAKSSKIQALPNETEPVEAQKPDEDPSSSGSGASAQTTPSDRDYYQQLYDAGGFSGDLDLYAQLYVCFNDDAHSGRFFTFYAAGYDEKFSKALDELYRDMTGDIFDQLGEKNEMDIMDAITEKVPYVFFMSNTFFKEYGSSAEDQQFFRGSGVELINTAYQKGVEVGGLPYKWDGGSSWVFTLPPDPTYPFSEKLLLSIEPTTMRYLISATDTTTTSTLSAGVCEKVPPKVPKD